MISRWARLPLLDSPPPDCAEERLKGMVAARSMRDTAVGLELYVGVFCIVDGIFLERIYRFEKRIFEKC
jgi:hypothetical protein